MVQRFRTYLVFRYIIFCKYICLPTCFSSEIGPQFSYLLGHIVLHLCKLKRPPKNEGKKLAMQVTYLHILYWRNF